MLKISEKELKIGLEIAGDADRCQDLIYCLSGKEFFPECADCHILWFRKKFESDSPALYYLFKNLCGYEEIIHDKWALQIEGTREQSIQAKERFDDLVNFGPTAIVGLYPLFLANGETFPLISWQEMEKEKEEFLKAGNEKFTEIIPGVRKINDFWADWLFGALQNNTDVKKYGMIIFWIIHLFIKYMAKIFPVSLKEDRQLFKEIKKFLAEKPNA